MKIEYEYANIMSILTVQQKEQMKILLKAIREKGVKRLRITNNSFKDFEEGFSGIVLLLQLSRESAAVYWRKEGKLHREDGPAVEEFCFRSGLFFSAGHYYQDRYCSGLFSSIEILREDIEKSGYLILEDTRINRNIVRLKILSKTEVNELYYWIQSHE